MAISTSIQKLELSHLAPTAQLELLNGDVNLEEFFLEMRNKAGIELISAITSASVQRTVQGASALTVEVDDDISRTVLRSGKLGRRMDVNLDGLWFTLVGVRKVQRKLSLTFEEREVNLLRYYDSFIQAERDKVNRAHFVLRMIKEVKEVTLKWCIPELNADQIISDLQPGQVLVDNTGVPLAEPTPPASGHSSLPGIPTSAELYVKDQPATPEQLNNANIILTTGFAMGAYRKILVCSIMTAIDESSIINLVGGDRDSVGVFQQRASMGWPATRNVAVDAAEFFKRAMQYDSMYPNVSYNDLCQAVQHSGTPLAYGQYQAEAEEFVNAFGVTSDPGMAGDAQAAAANNSGTAVVSAAPYQFTRGTLSQDSQKRAILTKENSWQCMQRLANEVDWACFCVSGVIYFISQQKLFQAKPYMVIDEDTDGIQWIDFDYDEGKREATVTVSCHLGRWSAPPGSIVQIQRMGIVNGRWLVNDVTRDLYSTEGTITLKKPLPKLPEPVTSAASNILSGAPSAAAPAGATTATQPTVSMNERQQKLVDYVTSQLGTPYVFGGDTPGQAFDCSGLTMVAYETIGIDLPHNALAQYQMGPLVSGSLMPGDIVFFGPEDGAAVGHCGIYIGNGQMIDAPDTGSVVRVDPINQFNPPYVGATRPWENS